MVSSSQLKLIRSLRQKKYRDRHRLFLVEGEKMVRELATGEAADRFQIRELVATPEWLERFGLDLKLQQVQITEASYGEIKKISNLVTPQPVLALVSMPETSFSTIELLNQPVLAFESIRDPGNLGTIIRTADWFGIGHLICTPDSTDLFNPKVVQSTMGAISRVQVHYLDLWSLLNNQEMQTKTIYGTFLEGQNIYKTSLDPDSIILFGNESRGLSKVLSPFISQKISIPSFSAKGKGSESLNLASSVAVVCSELRRT